MEVIYKASDETKRIIQDWVESDFVSGEMPYSWFYKQPISYKSSFNLETRLNNIKLAKLNTLQYNSEEVIKPLSTAEFIYVVKIEGNSNVIGYGVTNDWVSRSKRHMKTVQKDGSIITQWNVFKVASGRAREVEKSISGTFPAEQCKLEGFIIESTSLALHHSLLEYLTEMSPEAV